MVLEQAARLTQDKAVRFAALDPASIRDEENGIRQAQITLVERRGHNHVDGGCLHPSLPVLLGGYWQPPRLARPRGAGQLRRIGSHHGPEVRGADFGGS